MAGTPARYPRRTPSTRTRLSPPELTTYFESQTAGGQRQLTYRGFEMILFYGFFGTIPSYPTPQIDICDAVVNPNVPSRWMPGPTTYVSFASIPGLIPGNLPPVPRIFFGADLGPGGAVKIPAGNMAGGALTMVWRGFAVSTAPIGLFAVSSANEPNTGSPDATISYSGILTPTGPQVLPNPGFSGEFCWSWLFENSMIQPIRNPKLVSASGLILGGVPSPAPFAFQMDDGRGAIHPVPGDAISYNGNSKEGNPPPGMAGATWFVPFVLHSGYLAFGTNPPLEPWTSGPFATDSTPVRKWIDDFCGITTLCPSPGTGAVLNAANSTYGMWMGVKLPTYLNMMALVENLGFADISNGVSWAGPSILAYNSATNPAGLLGRNLISFAGSNTWTATGASIAGTMEHRAVLYPQAGYTPFVPIGGGFVGFGFLPASLHGTWLGVQCWMLDTVTTQIVDVTNVAVVRL